MMLRVKLKINNNTVISPISNMIEPKACSYLGFVWILVTRLLINIRQVIKNHQSDSSPGQVYLQAIDGQPAYKN